MTQLNPRVAIIVASEIIDAVPSCWLVPQIGRLWKMHSGIGVKIALLAGLIALYAPNADALTTQECLSADNHVYLIITTQSSNIGTQVTSVGMNASSPCSVSEIGAMGEVLTAYAGGPGPLLPNRMRTTVLSGFESNSLSCAANFDPAGANGQGILTLPGPGLRTVSADAGFTTEALVAVTTADATVPAAVDINTSRTIPGPIVCNGNTMVFPRGGVGTTLSDPTTGEVANQSVTLDDTSGTRVGNPASQPTTPDGFLLQGNCTAGATCQIIVFVAEPNPMVNSYGVSAAGFTVDGSLIQVQTEAAQQNNIFNTVTPTPTDTPIPTNTIHTPTTTATPTPTEVPSSPHSLILTFARLRVDTSFARDNGTVVIRGVVNDGGTEGNLVSSLLAGAATLEIESPPAFTATISLTGCTNPGKVIRCRSEDRLVRAVFRGGLAPELFRMVVRARGLNSSATGPVQPTGPVTVRLRQSHVVRPDDISDCRQRGIAVLVCREG